MVNCTAGTVATVERVPEVMVRVVRGWPGRGAAEILEGTPVTTPGFEPT